MLNDPILQHFFHLFINLILLLWRVLVRSYVHRLSSWNERNLMILGPGGRQCSGLLEQVLKLMYH
jgi:hypothetical protein